jgi:hypothetical protein
MNMHLGLFGGVLNAPQPLPLELVANCATYRDAVRLSWAHRRIQAMTLRTLAERIGSYPSHVTDYLKEDDAPSRRNLPADKLGAWCCAIGNLAVQQWLQIDAERQLFESLNLTPQIKPTQLAA